MDVEYQILLAIAMSCLIAIVLVFVNIKKPDFLKIDAHWLVVSALPVLIVLFLNGYINKIEGAGFTIERSIEQSVGNKVGLDGSLVEGVAIQQAVEEDSAAAKRSLDKLYSLTEKERHNVDRLVFQNGYGNYDADVINEYIKELRNVEYIEIVDSNGFFEGLIPVEHIRGTHAWRFEKSLAEGKVGRDFSDVLITDSLSRKTTVVDALIKVKESEKQYLPFLEYGKMIGVVTEASINDLVSEEIMKAVRTTD